MEGKNRIGLKAELLVKQRHMNFSLDGHEIEFPLSILKKLTTNQQKVLQVLFAKSLHANSVNETYRGEFSFAKSEVYDQG